VQKIYHICASNTKVSEERKYQLPIYIYGRITKNTHCWLRSYADTMTTCHYTLQFNRIEDIMSGLNTRLVCFSEEMRHVKIPTKRDALKYYSYESIPIL